MSKREKEKERGEKKKDKRRKEKNSDEDKGRRGRRGPSTTAGSRQCPEWGILRDVLQRGQP